MRNTKKKKMMVKPKIHNHKYDTRSKRNCHLCSSTQGCIGAKEHDIQIRLVGRRQGIRNKRLVACSAHTCGLLDELIYTILLLIPAKLLHENMSFVSRVWRQTITSPCFIANHLQISSARTQGLVVDHPDQQNNVALYINPEFQVTELPKPPFDSRIRGSYHGLVLLQHQVNIDQFHVVNLITKSIVSRLPAFPLLANLSPDSLDFSWTGVAFSYASSINRYKVVIGIHPHFKNIFQCPPRPQVWVYTLGVDQNWRKLKLRAIHTTFDTSSRIPFNNPKSVGGIVYWSDPSYPYGCALDVDTETFCRFTTFPTPKNNPKIDFLNYWIICLQTGLGLVISYAFAVSWKLYELTDLKSSKWTKIIDIDVRDIRSQVEKYFQSTEFRTFRPLVYTNDEKLWFFSWFPSVDMFYYNLRERNVVPVPVPVIGEAISAYHHVNTLLTFKNYC